MRMPWLAVLLMLALPAMAADFRPFGRDSRAAIERTHAGQPFVLVFWSVDCAYCAEEIKRLHALVRDHPAITLVLVSTDGMEAAAQAAAMLDERLRGTPAERWMFADADADRLYFSVDPKWHGELPRAYFYDAAGQAQAMAGQVDRRWLRVWAQSVMTTTSR